MALTDEAAAKARENPEIPPLSVQRMGKKWRIVYAETKGLARYNSGDPLDGGGFSDNWENGQLIETGQAAAMAKLSQIVGAATAAGGVYQDPEAENIGH